MTGMFKLFKKPPEIPEEMDYLADSPANALDSPVESPADDGAGQEMPAGVAAKRAARESSKRGWPLMLLGFLLFAVVAFGAYYGLKMYYAPVPAELPSGDILSSLASNPSVSPSSEKTSLPAPTQPKPAPLKPAKPDKPAVPSAAPTKNTPTQQPSEQPKPDQANPAPSPEASSKQEAKTEPSPDLLSGIFSGNPFVDLSSLRSYAAASSSNNMQMPSFGGSGNMALPEVPRPAVSPDLLPSPGEIRTPAGPAGASGSAPTMGGIIKSESGSAIAIMGDGTVLSEGDTYKGDRRVTFIGGEGIEFDDGASIAFGGQKK